MAHKEVHIDVLLHNGWHGECDAKVETMQQAFDVARDLIFGLYPSTTGATVSIKLVAEIDDAKDH